MAMQKHGAACKIGLVFACFLTLAAPSADAQQLIKRCAGVEVRSMKVSLKLVQDMPLDAQQETIETSDEGTERQDITVVARGPVLGSMDSEKLNTDLACSNDGLVLTATITRSANYHGALRQNQNWFPKITIVVVPLQSEIVFQTIWNMRLTNGRIVDRGRTLPYLEKKYPITLTKILHGRRN
jgi:hypothetical protein